MIFKRTRDKPSHASSHTPIFILCLPNFECKTKKIRYNKSDWIHKWLSTMKSKTPLHKRIHRNTVKVSIQKWDHTTENQAKRSGLNFFLFMLISQQIAAFWRLSFWRIKADRSKKNYNYIIGYLALETYQNICCRLKPLSIWSLNCFHHYSNNMKQLRSILRLTIFNIFSPSLKASKKFINIF